MRDVLLLLYCAAIGFVASGVASSFYKMVTTQPARFAMMGEGWLGAAGTLAFCGVAGPAIIADLALRNWLAKRGAHALLLMGTGIAALWSACSGVIMLELVFTIGGLPA
jgi:hypothetical protein